MLKFEGKGKAIGICCFAFKQKTNKLYKFINWGFYVTYALNYALLWCILCGLGPPCPTLIQALLWSKWEQILQESCKKLPMISLVLHISYTMNIFHHLCAFHNFSCFLIGYIQWLQSINGRDLEKKNDPWNIKSLFVSPQGMMDNMLQGKL